MPFDESVKASVRKRAHFACCLCHDLGVEVHHIVPEAEGGPDVIENAAPLCPTCHERYGANPTKRKFIREARDFWFEVCAERYGSDAARLTEIQSALAETATKQDVERVIEHVRALMPDSSDGEGLPPLPPGLGQKPITASSIRQYLRFMYPTVAHCGPAMSESLAVDLREIGYETIAGLHYIVGGTKEPFAEVVQDRRDSGEKRMDSAGDDWPVRLFLALLDESYCKRHYPGIYERRLKEGNHRWHRPAGAPEPSSPPWSSGALGKTSRRPSIARGSPKASEPSSKQTADSVKRSISD